MSKSPTNITDTITDTTDTYVYFEDQLACGHTQQRLYQNPCALITAFEPVEVEAALARIEQYRAQGFYLAGYFSYELGYVLEPALYNRLPKNRTVPLLQFGVFDKFREASLLDDSQASLGSPKPDLLFADYHEKFQKGMALIRAGDVYQINLTFSLNGTYSGSPAALYGHLKPAQPVQYGGVVNLGGDALVTLSPELFFEQSLNHITMRPMKGTAARGANQAQDKANAIALQNDPKNRAENLMIVDLLRNDLSRITTQGSVKVTELFTLETYPSLHTLTSKIEAHLPPTSVHDTLRALFPCGSITGAPKIRAMDIIRDLEVRPRGAYCGAMGVFDPDGFTRFNVAIRTLSLAQDGHYSYGVGSGVVADSHAKSEYDECLLKAQFLNAKARSPKARRTKDRRTKARSPKACAEIPTFGLIETLGWHQDTGFMWLDLHLQRLASSALAFGFAWSAKRFVHELTQCVSQKHGAHKVRVELVANGDMQTHAVALTFSPPNQPWRVSLSKNAVLSQDNYRAHKTTRRGFIDTELSRLKTLTDCQEVLFFNEYNEACEGSYTNIFIGKNGRLLTPPLSCGLLPGILREVMISSGDAVEQVLRLDDLKSADAIFIGNSLRGLIRAELTGLERQ